MCEWTFINFRSPTTSAEREGWRAFPISGYNHFQKEIIYLHYKPSQGITSRAATGRGNRAGVAGLWGIYEGLAAPRGVRWGISDRDSAEGTEYNQAAAVAETDGEEDLQPSPHLRDCWDFVVVIALFGSIGPVYVETWDYSGFSLIWKLRVLIFGVKSLAIFTENHVSTCTAYRTFAIALYWYLMLSSFMFCGSYIVFVSIKCKSMPIQTLCELDTSFLTIMDLQCANPGRHSSEQMFCCCSFGIAGLRVSTCWVHCLEKVGAIPAFEYVGELNFAFISANGGLLGSVSLNGAELSIYELLCWPLSYPVNEGLRVLGRIGFFKLPRIRWRGYVYSVCCAHSHWKTIHPCLFPMR